MTDIKLDNEILNYISIFEMTTKVACLDCLVEPEMVVYLVPNEDILKAIGKNGDNVKKLRTKLNRNVRVVGKSDDPVVFLRSLFKSFPINDIMIQKKGNKVVAVIQTDPTCKGKLIGKGGKNLNIAKTLIRRQNLNVDEISVI